MFYVHWCIPRQGGWPNQVNHPWLHIWAVASVHDAFTPRQVDHRPDHSPPRARAIDPLLAPKCKEQGRRRRWRRRRPTRRGRCGGRWRRSRWWWWGGAGAAWRTSRGACCWGRARTGGARGRRRRRPAALVDAALQARRRKDGGDKAAAGDGGGGAAVAFRRCSSAGGWWAGSIGSWPCTWPASSCRSWSRQEPCGSELIFVISDERERVIRLKTYACPFWSFLTVDLFVLRSRYNSIFNCVDHMETSKLQRNRVDQSRDVHKVIMNLIGLDQSQIVLWFIPTMPQDIRTYFPCWCWSMQLWSAHQNVFTWMFHSPV